MELPFSIRYLLIAFLCLSGLTGCGIGTRFIFSSSTDVLATPDQRGIAYEDIWFAAEDGTRLHGWYIPGEPGQPLVLFFHGNAANISHRVENLHSLRSMDFSVFIFDYRGFGRSEGWPRSEADLGRDARGALRWLRDRGWTPDRMIYLGSSMGAAVALQAALENPPAGVVLEAPFTSLPDIARRLSPVTYALLGWWSIDDRFDNLERIGQLTVPLLIFQGDRDSIVPEEMPRRLFGRARDPKAFVIVPGTGHSDPYRGSEYRPAWLRFTSSLSDKAAASR